MLSLTHRTQHLMERTLRVGHTFSDSGVRYGTGRSMFRPRRRTQTFRFHCTIPDILNKGIQHAKNCSKTYY